MRTVRPAGEKQPTRFMLFVEKISICTTGVSKECPRSHIIVAQAFGLLTDLVQHDMTHKIKNIYWQQIAYRDVSNK